MPQTCLVLSQMAFLSLLPLELQFSYQTYKIQIVTSGIIALDTTDIDRVLLSNQKKTGFGVQK